MNARERLIFESEVLPYNVNPLSVSIQSSGKKRLISDLRFVNMHVWKQKVKFEYLQVALNYFDKGHFMFSFDIKSGYYHVFIFPPHQTLMGFSWFYQGKVRYLCLKGPALWPLFSPFCFHKDF